MKFKAFIRKLADMGWDGDNIMVYNGNEPVPEYRCWRRLDAAFIPNLKGIAHQTTKMLIVKKVVPT